MRIRIMASALCLFALAGCEQSYSSSRTVTESGGVTVERSVEVQIGGPREPSAAGNSGAAPGATAMPVAPVASAAPDTPVASQG
jgi:hypothetical protein